MAVRDAIEEYEPSLVLCGHIHEARGVDTLEKTTIVNCGFGRTGCYAIIDGENDLVVTLKKIPL